MSDQQAPSQQQVPLEENKLTPQAGPVDGDTETTPAADPLADVPTNGQTQPTGSDPADIDSEDEDEEAADSENDIEEE